MLPSLGMLLILCAGATPDAAGNAVIAHACDSLAGMKIAWGAQLPAARLELNVDPRFRAEGAASVHLSAQSGPKTTPRFYLGVRIPLAGLKLDSRAFLFDCWTSTPAAAQAIYLRLYAAGGRKAGAWHNWSSPFSAAPRLTVQLDQELGAGGFRWAAEEINAPLDAPLEAAEIVIGTREPNARFDIYIDNLRVSAARRVPFARISAPKRLVRETALAADGRALAVVVAPQRPEYLELARRIQSRVRELSGVELPVVGADKFTREQATASACLFLGNVGVNPALVELYALLYTPVDEAFPPAGGYLVHTVHDPWGVGRNAVVLGASDLAGAKKAVDAFLKSLAPGRTLTLPKLNLFDLDAADMKAAKRFATTFNKEDVRLQVEAARRDFQRGAHRTVAGRMADYGFRYGGAGGDVLATLYKELAVAWHESYQAKPDIYGGPWGMDMDFHLMEILPAWDLVEESPALSDADRLQVTKILHEFITTDVVRKAAGALTSKHVRHNHMTFPALGLFYAGRYFKQGYGCPEAEHWLDVARACFTLQARAAKPYEDCNGYGWLVPLHTLRYSLATGDSAYFANGNVRRQADYAVLTMDNLGYQVPYGDTGSYQCWWSEVPFLRGAEVYHRDGRWAWALEKKQAVHRDARRQEFICRVPPKEPVDLLGCRAIPLDKMYWESFNGPKTIPWEKAVDKVVMRASFDPQRQYLLLDGLANGGHMHFDGNSISRITDRGRIWLADNDYIRSLPKFHNSLLVFRDGQAGSLPPYCELDAVADARAFGAAQTAVRDYNGADWRRTILWGKDRFFLVLDDLTAREPAEYDFHCLWHTVGEAQLTPSGMEVAQQGPRMRIATLPGLRLKLSDDVELGKNWNGYAFAAPVVRRFREVQTSRLAAGQRVGFANLIYTGDAARMPNYSVAPLHGDRAVRIHGDGLDLVAGATDGAAPLEIVPGLRIAAQAFALGESEGLAVGATQLACAELELRAERPMNVELIDGRLEIAAPAAAHLRLLKQSSKPEVSGAAASVVQRDNGWEIALGAGKSVVRLAQPLRLSALANLKPQPSAPASTAASQTALPSFGRPLWEYAPTQSGAATALAVGDLDGDGRDETLAAIGSNAMVCLDAQGKVRWQFTAKGRITTVTSAGFDCGKTRLAIAGSEDCRVYAIEPDGKLRWSFEMPTYKGLGRVRALFAADLDGDGCDEIVAGGDNWRYYAIDSLGKERWHYESVHPSTAGAAADLDGDGKLEVLCGTAYYWWHCANADGSRRWSYSVKMPHATAALSMRGDRAGERIALFGAEDGALHAISAAGKPLWQASVGDEVTAAAVVDLQGRGRDAVVAGSASFQVAAFDSAGKRLWRTNMGDAVRSLIAVHFGGAAGPQLAVGCDDGRLALLDVQGRIVAERRFPAAVAALTQARLPDGAAVIVRLSSGRVAAIRAQ